MIENQENFNEEEKLNEEVLNQQDTNGEDVDNQETETSEESDAEEKKEDSVEEQLAKAQAQVEEYKDKYLRQLAEFDNYRRRVMKEKAELIKNGGEKVMTAILPILDDFERALSTMEKSEDKAHYEGIMLIYNKLKRTLEQKGLEEIKAMGEPFNTDEHEALTQIPAPDESQKDKVIDVVQKGYKLNGKVIRYARVVVGC